MNIEKLPELGKIHPEFFDRVIYPRLGTYSEDVVIGPRHGVDYGVLKVDGEVGNKKKYDPRSWLKAARESMAKRIVQACDDLLSTGKTIGR